MPRHGVHAAVMSHLATLAVPWGCGGHLSWSPMKQERSMKQEQAVAHRSPLKNILSRDISVVSFSFEVQTEHQLMNKVKRFV